MPPCSELMESAVEQLSQSANAPPLPGTEAYEALPQFPKRTPLPFRRTIRRQELRQIVPLAETTIYEMERRGEFPRRFNLTPRCVVWDLAEIEAWIEQRKQAPRGGASKSDVHLRKKPALFGRVRVRNEARQRLSCNQAVALNAGTTTFSGISFGT